MFEAKPSTGSILFPLLALTSFANLFMAGISLGIALARHQEAHRSSGTKCARGLGILASHEPLEATSVKASRPPNNDS